MLAVYQTSFFGLWTLFLAKAPTPTKHTFQVQRGVENTSYLEEDFADHCKEIDAQVPCEASTRESKQDLVGRHGHISVKRMAPRN